MINKIKAHVEKKHWVLIMQSEVPQDADAIPVCSICSKYDLTTNAILKYKVRLIP